MGVLLQPCRVRIVLAIALGFTLLCCTAGAALDLTAHEAQLFARISGTHALAHGVLADHVRERAHTRSRSHWDADVLIVVTHHRRNLDGLRRFPFDSGLVRVALLVKGSERKCDADVPVWLIPHVVLCQELPNEEGRDSHSVAWFLYTYYHSLPRLIFFAQDDERGRDELRFVPRGNATAFEEWVARAEDDPFADSETCLCGINVERWESADQYGGSYLSMQLVMAMLGHNVSDVQSLRWPGAQHFVLSSRAARHAPRLFYGLMLELLRSSTGAHTGAVPALYICNEAEPLTEKRCRSPTDHAHMLERMLWLVLDPHYRTREGVVVASGAG